MATVMDSAVRRGARAGAGAGDVDATAERPAYDESALGARANAGDRAAMGEYFAQRLPLLQGVARNLAGGLIDPEDLLGDAMASVVEKWARGAGPTTYLTAYIAQSMRNRVKDELRSPRSRVGGLADVDEPAADDAAARRAVEWHRERELVRRALHAMPADQRAVLLGVVVHERKPAELAVDLDRPAGAVSSLLRRAKLRLRRAMLAEALVGSADSAACLAAVRRLPEALPSSLDGAPDAPAWRHIGGCRSCRTGWSLYGSVVESAALSA